MCLFCVLCAIAFSCNYCQMRGRGNPVRDGIFVTAILYVMRKIPQGMTSFHKAIQVRTTHPKRNFERIVIATEGKRTQALRKAWPKGLAPYSVFPVKKSKKTQSYGLERTGLATVLPHTGQWPAAPAVKCFGVFLLVCCSFFAVDVD